MHTEYLMIITVKCSRSVWGHSVHFQVLTTLCTFSEIFALLSLYLIGIFYLASDRAEDQGPGLLLKFPLPLGSDVNESDKTIV